MHCALFLGEPFYLSTLLTHQSNIHSLCSTSFSPFLLPYFNNKSNSLRTFSAHYAAPFIWNHLPNICSHMPIYMSFRRNLKTCLFNQASPTWTVFLIRNHLWLLTALYFGYFPWSSWLRTSVYWGS